MKKQKAFIRLVDENIHIGDKAQLVLASGDVVRTSSVISISDNYIETMNTIYIRYNQGNVNDIKQNVITPQIMPKKTDVAPVYVQNVPMQNVPVQNNVSQVVQSDNANIEASSSVAVDESGNIVINNKVKHTSKKNPAKEALLTSILTDDDLKEREDAMKEVKKVKVKKPMTVEERISAAKKLTIIADIDED